MLTFYNIKSEYTVLFNVENNFSWDIEGEVETTFDFSWDISEPSLYYYLIEGRCIKSDCNTTGYNNQDELCNSNSDSLFIGQSYEQIVLARSLKEVCFILKQRRFNYPFNWSIKSIKKYSRPAEFDIISLQENLGIDHSCLSLIEQTFCQLPECQDFCVDFHLNQNVKLNFNVEFIFETYISQGSLTFYSYESEFEKNFNSLSQLNFYGNSEIICNNLLLESEYSLNFNPSNDLISSNWNFESEGGLNFSGSLLGSSTYFSLISNGQLILAGSNTLKSNLFWTTLIGRNLIFSGNSEHYVNNIEFESEGNLEFSGNSLVLLSYYEFESECSLNFNPSNDLISSNWNFESEGGLNFNSQSKIIIDLFNKFTIQLNPISIIKRYIISNSYVNFSGESIKVSPSWNSESIGNTIFYGNSFYESSDKGEYEVSFNIDASIDFFDLGLEQIDINPLVLSSSLIQTSCGCNPLSSTINFYSNYFNNNKFYNFILKNNLIYDDKINFSYNKINNMWMYNNNYVGIGEVGQERWRTLFNLSCINEFSGESLSQPSFKFYLFFEKISLTFNQDYYTMISGILNPAEVCIFNGNININLILNTTTKTIIESNAEIDYFTFVDEIGLFNSQYWKRNNRLILKFSSLPLTNEIGNIKII